MPQFDAHEDLPARLRAALTRAMKDRDPIAVSALRSAIAAIDNAAAVDPAQAPKAGGGRIAGAVGGVGAAEVPRRELSARDIEAIVLREIAHREGAAAEYERLGRPGEAVRARAEIAVLAAQIDDAT